MAQIYTRPVISAAPSSRLLTEPERLGCQHAERRRKSLGAAVPPFVDGNSDRPATTVVRLRSGELAIHSTAPFTVSDVNAIGALGRPAWLVEATLFHDTFSKDGQAAFPEIPYLVPEGFAGLGTSSAAHQHILSLSKSPAVWGNELHVLQLEGMPKVREHVFFHQPTRTLIVADLVFNFGPESTPWTRWFFRYAGGIRQFPGMTRLFRACIRDRAAFAESARQMTRWDFDRLIVGHGDIIECGAKAKLTAALASQGFSV